MELKKREKEGKETIRAPSESTLPSKRASDSVDLLRREHVITSFTVCQQHTYLAQ